MEKDIPCCEREFVQKNYLTMASVFQVASLSQSTMKNTNNLQEPKENQKEVQVIWGQVKDHVPKSHYGSRAGLHTPCVKINPDPFNRSVCSNNKFSMKSRKSSWFFKCCSDSNTDPTYSFYSQHWSNENCRDSVLQSSVVMSALKYYFSYHCISDFQHFCLCGLGKLYFRSLMHYEQNDFNMNSHLLKHNFCLQQISNGKKKTPKTQNVETLKLFSLVGMSGVRSFFTMEKVMKNSEQVTLLPYYPVFMTYWSVNSLDADGVLYVSQYY